MKKMTPEEFFMFWDNDKISDPLMIVPKPTPPKIERARTRYEKIGILRNKASDTDAPWDYSDLSDSTIDDLCHAANISLIVLEEV